MTTEYATNGLCESAIPTPPVVNLSSVLNQESVQGIHDLQNVNENIKHNSNVNVLLLHTFVSSDGKK